MTTPAPSRRRGLLKHVATALALLIVLYLLIAYLLLPLGWIRYADRHPKWEDSPRITHTGDDIPGDPLNLALVGTERELKKAMLKAGWYPADPLTLESCLEIADASVFKRPYEDAPVSNLFLFGRKQDLAFEMPVGDDPRQRHHVRFWKWGKPAPDGSPVFLGSATYDQRVGLSDTTGQITHHIGPDIDAERDHVIHSLQLASLLSESYFIPNFQQPPEGRNGGGDPWHTDGNLAVGILKPAPPKNTP